MIKDGHIESCMFKMAIYERKGTNIGSLIKNNEQNKGGEIEE